MKWSARAHQDQRLQAIAFVCVLFWISVSFRQTHRFKCPEKNTYVTWISRHKNQNLCSGCVEEWSFRGIYRFVWATKLLAFYANASVISQRMILFWSRNSVSFAQEQAGNRKNSYLTQNEGIHASILSLKLMKWIQSAEIRFRRHHFGPINDRERWKNRIDVLAHGMCRTTSLFWTWTVLCKS